MTSSDALMDALRQDTNQDLLNEVVKTVYDACLGEGNWGEILNTVCRMLDGQAAALISYDVQAKTGLMHHAVGLGQGFARTYADHFAAHDIWLRRLKPLSKPGAIQAGEEMVGERAQTSSDFHNQWLAPQGLFHAMWGELLFEEDTVLVLMVYRSEDTGMFNGRDKEALAAVMPHLRRALKIHEIMSRVQLEREAALGALDHLPIGVLLLGRRGRVLETNSYANDILAENDGLSVVRGMIRTTSREETEQLRRMVVARIDPMQECPSEASDTILVSRPSGQPPLNLLVAMVPVSTRFLGELRRAAVVFVTSPERHHELSQRRLREMFDLTPAEGRLASLIGQGWRLEDAAEDLGVSLNTVRTHLKRIFAKTGTTRQVDLVRLILSSPAQIRAE